MGFYREFAGRNTLIESTQKIYSTWTVSTNTQRFCNRSQQTRQRKLEIYFEVLKKTVKLAAEQIGLAWGFNQELVKLRDSLQSVEAILCDNDRIKSQYPSMKPWVEKLEDIVFEADVLLDELAYEDLRLKVETGKYAMKV